MEKKLREVERGLLESAGALAATRGRLDYLAEGADKYACELGDVSCALAVITARLEGLQDDARRLITLCGA